MLIEMLLQEDVIWHFLTNDTRFKLEYIYPNIKF